MADENTEVLQPSQPSPAANESESTTEVESTTTEVTTEEQSEHSSETQDGNTENQSEQTEQKPSRIERRIESLVSKLKDAGQSATQAEVTPKKQEINGNQPLITPEEAERGELDPQTLEQRIEARIQASIQQAREEERRNVQLEQSKQAYVSAVQEHIKDSESVMGNVDPNIERLALEQYEALNYQINPFTGERVLVPAVKLSEIVGRLKETFETAVAAAAQGNRQYAQAVDQSSAVPTGGHVPSSTKVSSDTTDFAEFEKTYGSKTK